MLGAHHPSKPVLPSQKVMSVRHLARRTEIQSMPDGKDKYLKAHKYDIAHAAEHIVDAKKVGKKLAKMGVKIAKKSYPSLSQMK